MGEPARDWMRERETVDRIGSATSKMFSFVKKRPQFRSVGMRAIATGVRAAARGRHPLHQAPRPFEIVPSARDWAQDRRGVKFTSVLGPEQSINPPPQSIAGIVDWEYRKIEDVSLPAPFVIEIENGHAVGEHGVVIGPDGSLIHDTSLPIGGLRSYLWRAHGNLPDEHDIPIDWRLPPRRLKGAAAVLTTHLGRGYFHWLFDVLPRLKLLREAGYSLDAFDHFIVPAYFSSFQIETLTALGIPRRKIVSSLLNRHLTADNLVVPSVVRQKGVVPQWACDFLREAFRPERPEHITVGDRAYLVRKVTDHGFVTDEQAMVQGLEDFGFTPLAAEDLTFAQKAWVFGNLEAVVAAEGGGLSNIVFGKPGAVAIELRVRALPAMDYGVIANRVGMRLYDVYGDDYERDDSEPTVKQGPVQAKHVLETFEMAGLRPRA